MIFPAMEEFKKEYPDIKFKIINDTNPALMSILYDKLIDMSIITTSSCDSLEYNNFSKKIIHSYKDVPIAGINFKELANRKVYLKELMDYPLISLWHDTETYSYYRNYYAEHGLEFNPAIETTSTGQTLGYVKGNIGLACIHEQEAEAAIKEKKGFKIDLIEKLPTRYIALIHDKSAEKKALSLFINLLVNYVK